MAEFNEALPDFGWDGRKGVVVGRFVGVRVGFYGGGSSIWG